jgi:MinD superfamily P-loop ATPase
VRLAVASGKGGTGKTTVAVNLARVWNGPVQLLDCDVEAPNAGLFLKGEQLRTETVGVPVPSVDESLCTGCGTCSAFCEFNAIACAGGTAMVFPEMCHGCGGCTLLCPEGALTETEHRIGVVETVKAGSITLIRGRLDVGAAMAPPLIRQVKQRASSEIPGIIDCPPGTSCPVITAVKGSDMVLLVTEPTPFGLHDLELAVETVGELGIPFGVVLNRSGSGDLGVQKFCASRGISLLLEIPDDRRYAEAYSRGELLADSFPGLKDLFTGLRVELEKR